MAGLAPKDQAGAWQLISVNICRQCTSDIAVIAEKLLEFACMRAHLPVIFSIQETRFWDVPNLEVAWMCVFWKQTWARHVVGFGSVVQKLRDRGGSKRDVQCSLKHLW